MTPPPPSGPRQVAATRPSSTLDGSSHPPQSAKTATVSPAQAEIAGAMQWMRGEMIREFIIRLRRKANADHVTAGNTIRRMRKRKAALAMSAAVMTVSPGMVEFGRQAPAYVAAMHLDGFDVRLHPAQLRASEAMKEALAEEEGVRLTVYRDVAGYPTVGVGHLVTEADGLKVGDRITYGQALEFLERDLAHAEDAVARLTGDLPLFQNEFDALVDLVYNVGEGNVSQSESPRLNSAIAARDYDAIAAELDYFHAGGAFTDGLVYRSERRQAIFMNAAYDDPRPAAISVSGDLPGMTTI